MTGYVKRSDEEVVVAWESWAKNSTEPDVPIVVVSGKKYSPMAFSGILRKLLNEQKNGKRVDEETFWIIFVTKAQIDALEKGYDLVEKILPKRR